MTHSIIKHEELPTWPKLIDATDLRWGELLRFTDLKQREGLMPDQVDLWREEDGTAVACFLGHEVAL